MSLQEFLKKNTGLSTANTTDLKNELAKRESLENVFPLEIFHEKLKPLIEAWVTKYDLDPGFIGLSLLSAYSTAIGTAFTVTTQPQPKRHDLRYLSIWACNVGISSSGKSVILDNAYRVLMNIQNEYDYQWAEETRGLSEMDIRNKPMPTVVFMDTFIPTLIRYQLPDNPKGVVKVADELVEWINGMDPGAKNGKEGTDQQFWLKTWNCAPAMVTRSGKQKTTLPRPFVNVIGGTQHEMLPRFFAKDRDITGYIFRLLFAIDDRNIAVDYDASFQMPEEYVRPYNRSIEILYKEFMVETTEDEPGVCILTTEAIAMYQSWVKQKQRSINELEDVKDRNIQHGIFGKIKEYAQRFCAILYLSDKVLENIDFVQRYELGISMTNVVDSSYMERAIKACEYFQKSATIAYERVQKQRYAPQEAIVAANMMKANHSMQKIADVVFNGKSKSADGRRQMLNRALKKWYLEYSWLFHSAKN